MINIDQKKADFMVFLFGFQNGPELNFRRRTSLNNLRLKALRIRTALKKCILDCMEREAAGREVVM